MTPFALSGGMTPFALSGGMTTVALSGGMTTVALSGGMTPVALSGGMTPFALSGGMTPFALSGGMTPVALSNLFRSILADISDVLHLRLSQTRKPDFRFQCQLGGCNLAVIRIGAVNRAIRLCGEVPAVVAGFEVIQDIQWSLAAVKALVSAPDRSVILIGLSQFVLESAVALHVLVSAFVC
jgi:hypothetical protein